ncbi:MAG TPA: PhaM family polyhydroxyalkanoate granule multifunctional regulatory protein [Paucimonas sp.]|nr:PhaM family polyhydroxyalkanoate granule multifunctional regulatory protein [Paucimonas sp.]
MEKPTIPNLPGISAMTDTLEFVKNLWGGMKVPGVGMPGMVMPSLSVEEINKQIADLKAVESWLTVNMNMLRATIQALEVQSATLTTLQAMGDNLNAAMQKASKERPAEVKQAVAEPEAKADTRRKTRSRSEEEPKTAEPGDAGAAAVQPGGNGQGDIGAQLANPAVWWNLLQSQFKQAVGNAMTGEAAPAAKPAPAPADNGAASNAGSGAKRKPRSKAH